MGRIDDDIVGDSRVDDDNDSSRSSEDVLFIMHALNCRGLDSDGQASLPQDGDMDTVVQIALGYKHSCAV